MSRIAPADRGEGFKKAVAQISKVIRNGGSRDWYHLRQLSETACQIHGVKNMTEEVFAEARAENPSVRLIIAP